MKLDLQLMGLINIFEKITKAKVKTAFFDKDKILVFIVKQGEIGKAIGKKGVNVKKISSVMKRRVRIIEFNPDVVRFVSNCLLPLKPEVSSEDGKIIIKGSSRQEKGIIIGRDRCNLNALKEFVGKFFKDVEILVE